MQNKEKKKVLIVAGSMNMGGIENQVVQIVRNLSNEFDFSFFLPEAGGYYEKELIRYGCRIHYIRDSWFNLPNLVKLMKQEQFDIVHAHQLHHNALIVLAAWIAGVPKRISHSHSSRNSNTRNKALLKIYFSVSRKILLSFSTDLVACANNAGEFLYGPQIRDDKRYRVVHNAVAIEKYLYSVESGTEVLKEPGYKYIIHVGRFSAVKNHNFILQIAQQMKELDLKFRFWLVGDGDMREAVEANAKEQNLGQWVQFLGQRSDIPKLMNAADLFLLPSFYEGLPVTLIEAQAAGKKCIISDTITQEADFGIGLVQYLSLDEPIAHWIDAVNRACAAVGSLEKTMIKKVAAEKGFTEKAFIDSIKEVYSNKCTPE